MQASLYKEKIQEFESKFEELSLKLVQEIEKNNILDKEKNLLRNELIDLKNNLKLYSQALSQEKSKLEAKESYIPIMIKLSEEDANNRVLNVVKTNIEKETELESKIAELKQKTEEQTEIISKMRQAEREFFLNINKFGRQIAINSKKSLELQSDFLENQSSEAEIEPIVKRAIDHNDTRDKIKKSLLSSGYNEEIIDRILDRHLIKSEAK